MNNKEKWEDIIYNYMEWLLERKENNLFSTIWTMMIGHDIVEPNETYGISMNIENYDKFSSEYGKAIRKMMKTKNIPFYKIYHSSW